MLLLSRFGPRRTLRPPPIDSASAHAAYPAVAAHVVAYGSKKSALNRRTSPWAAAQGSLKSSQSYTGTLLCLPNQLPGTGVNPCHVEGKQTSQQHRPRRGEAFEDVARYCCRCGDFRRNRNNEQVTRVTFRQEISGGAHTRPDPKRLAAGALEQGQIISPILLYNRECRRKWVVPA